MTRPQSQAQASFRTSAFRRRVRGDAIPVRFALFERIS